MDNISSKSSKAERICRACMSKEQNFHSILEFGGTGVRICEMLATTTPQVLILPGDDLPKLICSICLNKLTISYNFQQMCIISDKRMRNDMSQQKENTNESSDGQSQNSFIAGGTENNLNVKLLAKEEYNFVELEMQEEFEPIVECLKVEIGEKEIENFFGFTDDQEQTQPNDGPNSERFVYSDSEDNDESDASIQIVQTPFALFPNGNDTQSHDDSSASMKVETKRIRKLNYACTICCKRFDRISRVEQHMKVHNKTLEHVCEICGFRYKTKFQLNSHKSAHSEKRKGLSTYKYQCMECPSRFQKPTSYAAHMLVHRRKIMKCNYCDKTFGQKNFLNQHLRSHKDELNKLKCMLCVKIFSNNNEYAEHTSMHAKVQPFECIYCNEVLYDTDSLKKHLHTHNSQSPYYCSKCATTFTDAANLQQHLLQHPTEYHITDCSGQGEQRLQSKSYICKICGCVYAHAYTLQKHHQLFHASEKNSILEQPLHETQPPSFPSSI